MFDQDVALAAVPFAEVEAAVVVVVAGAQKIAAEVGVVQQIAVVVAFAVVAAFAGAGAAAAEEEALVAVAAVVLEIVEIEAVEIVGQLAAAAARFGPAEAALAEFVEIGLAAAFDQHQDAALDQEQPIKNNETLVFPYIEQK